MFQDFIEQCHLRSQGGEVVLGEPQLDHAPEQRLRQLAHGQHRQTTTDPLLQLLEVRHYRFGVYLLVVFDGNPQRRLEQRGR
ncbi:hypothetical protein D3C73_1005650 [compost metagenome]